MTYTSLGPAPVLDFDGTLTRLAVPWDVLRELLAVQSVDALWEQGIEAWEPVLAAEVEAPRRAAPVSEVMQALAPARAFAVLSSNDEGTVADSRLDRSCADRRVSSSDGGRSAAARARLRCVRPRVHGMRAPRQRINGVTRPRFMSVTCHTNSTFRRADSGQSRWTSRRVMQT